MILLNRSKGALTAGTALLIMLSGCAQTNKSTAAEVANPPSAAPVVPSNANANNTDADAKPLYEVSRVEVSEADMGYVQIDKFPTSSAQINPVRWQALYETALSLGATGALAWRSEQINMSLDKNAGQLNQIFDFNQLLLKDNVLPPVLAESDNSLNIASSDSIRVAAKTFKIINPARFVTTPPNWRSYLTMSYPKPSVPDRSLLPKNQAEADVWNRFIRDGWQSGIQQGNSIFSANLSRLRRDYNGMVLYRKMLAQGMVSAPFVATADLGVTGDSKEMRIDDRVLRITAHSELQTDSTKWQPILVNPQQDFKP